MFLKFLFIFIFCFLNITKAENTKFFAIDSGITSNKIRSIYKGNTTNKNYLNIENKFYSEFNFNNEYIFSGYLKQNINKLYLENEINSKTRNNYFYNLAIKKNIFEEKIYFGFGYGDKIHSDKLYDCFESIDLYKTYQFILMGKFPIENNLIKTEITYNYLKDSFKNNIKFSIDYLIKKNLSSLLILGYEYEYEFITKLSNAKGNMLQEYVNKQYIKDELLVKKHTFSINSIFDFSENMSFSVKNSLNLDKHNKAFYTINFALWVK